MIRIMKLDVQEYDIVYLEFKHVRLDFKRVWKIFGNVVQESVRKVFNHPLNTLFYSVVQSVAYI